MEKMSLLIIDSLLITISAEHSYTIEIVRQLAESCLEGLEKTRRQKKNIKIIFLFI